jgi:hypothetical protein
MKEPARGWPDRPVLAEPHPEPELSQPWRVKLGTAMHLNGSVPRGVPLQGAIPKRCQGCGALFIVFGRGSARACYCEDCRAKTCPGNGRGGQHYAYCSTLKPRPCRGCGVELGHGGSQRRFCEACRAQRCPECGGQGGRHLRTCLYEQRQRRPAPTHLGLVTEQDVVELYRAYRAQAVRIARKICHHEAEDVVHDTTLYMLEKRDYLQPPTLKAYFFRAVWHAALRRRLYFWARSVVAMDPEALVLAEQAMARGKTSQNQVRLPSWEPGG